MISEKNIRRSVPSAELTILTPSYNYAQYIGECIASVFNQRAKLRVSQIIQDANSSDGTTQVVAGLSYPNLTFIQEADLGQSDALNKALARVDDDALVGWLNADEYYLQDSFLRVIEFAERFPEVDFFYGDCIFVDAKGKLIRAVPAHSMSGFVLENYGCFIMSCTTFVRARALKAHGWDVQFRRAMDWDLYLAMRSQSAFKYMPFYVAAFRVHDQQVTNTPESEDPEEFERLRIKHNIKKSKTKTIVAYAMHAALKLLNGGYFKQVALMLRENRIL